MACVHQMLAHNIGSMPVLAEQQLVGIITEVRRTHSTNSTQHTHTYTHLRHTQHTHTSTATHQHSNTPTLQHSNTTTQQRSNTTQPYSRNCTQQAHTPHKNAVLCCCCCCCCAVLCCAGLCCAMLLLCGVVLQTDIMTKTLDMQPPIAARVRDIMTLDPVTVAPHCTLSQVGCTHEL